MYLTDVSIRRPALSWVLSLILVVFGTFVFSKLPVRELPSGLQPPVVQVQVEYASASAPIVDEEVTQVIEEVIGGAEGIKNIDAKSENGKSTINIEFDNLYDFENIIKILKNSPGCKVIDERSDGGYMTPLEAEGSYTTYISRIRKDNSNIKAINLWVVSDNLLKGAALNTVQIAECLMKKL